MKRPLVIASILAGSAVSAVATAGAVSALAAGEPPRVAVKCLAPARRATPEPGAVAMADLDAGRALVERLQCTRCHGATGLDVAPAARETSCAGCHAWVAATAHDPVEYERQHKRFPYWDRYVESVGSFLAVPDLASSGARLDPGWVARYLREPYAVRPGLYERMLRAPVSEAESDAIATWLASSRRPLAGIAAEAARIPVSTAAADIAEGERLYRSQGCGTCHAFGPGDPEALAGAPDLAHTRSRMRPADVAAYIADPVSFGGRSAMPSFELPAVDAARLRDYVLGAPVGARAPAAVPADLPLLERAVAWEEVRARVFGRICVHCHMDPDANAGEGGPGNTGGLGFEGKGLDLETWEGIAHSSVLAPRGPGEEPPLIMRLRIRYAEHLHELGAAPAPAAGADRGMPLALPPLSPEDFRLVRSWVAQGAPGPDGRRAVRVDVAGR